jgi:hypothetical protein
MPAMHDGFVLYQLSTDEKEKRGRLPKHMHLPLDHPQNKSQLIIEAPSDLMVVQHTGI